MNILAISDEEMPLIYGPGIRKRFGDIDLVIGCGDLQFYYLEYVVTMLNVPVYYVLGNHDEPKQFMSDGRVATFAEGCVELEGRVAIEQDILMAGLGGSRRYKLKGQNQFTEWQMMRRALRLTPRLVLNRLQHGRYLDIFITHAPAKNIHDEDDIVHTGFRTFLWFVRTFRPRYMLHGHTHTYRRNKLWRTWYESTEIVNVHPYRRLTFALPTS